MADEVTRTIVDGMGGTGTALGAGVGGLFGSWFGNAWNGNGGFGGNNNTYLANQLSAIQTQAVANGIANREAVSGMSQHVSDAINSNGRDTNQAINNANVQAVKDSGDTRLTISQTGNNMAQLITALGANFAQAIGTINENITKTSYESRLQQQELVAKLSAQHAELLKAISDENCKDRELMRQIQTETIAGKLADEKAENTVLKQNGLLLTQFNQLAQAIAGLKPVTTTA